MSRRILFASALLLVLHLVAGSGYGGIELLTNGGFKEGDFTGWTQSVWSAPIGRCAFASLYTTPMLCEVSWG